MAQEVPRGKWKQTKKYLATQNGECAYCCLGVACEVAKANGVDVKERLVDGRWLFNGRQSDLPDNVIDAMKFRSPAGDITGTCLAAMNDDGKTFAQIAALVEADPSAVFTEEA